MSGYICLIMRPLEFMVSHQWHQSTGLKTDPIQLSDKGRMELDWCTGQFNLMKGHPFLPRDPQLVITMDAPSLGWVGGGGS